MMVNRMRAFALQPGATRFDRSSWITLSIVLAIFFATLAVAAASFNMPMDGWDIDRGAWGRYDKPIYLDEFSGESDLQAGDVLLAVEGVPFEQLEAQAASLDPQRPPNWKLGETVHYTVLREGEEVEATAILVRPPLFKLYSPQILIENPILLTFPIFLLISILVFALRPRQRAAQLLFLFGFAFFNEDFISYIVVPPGVADLFSNATYWPKIILGNMVWSFLIGAMLVHLFLTFPVEKRPLRRFPQLIPLFLYGTCAAASLLFVGLNISGHYISGVTFVTILVAPCLLLAAASLIHNFITVKDPVARMQVRWIALGGLLGIVGPVLIWMAAGGIGPRSPFWQGLLYLLLALTFPLSLAIAILRYRLWNIEVIINRTLIYGLLTASLALVYFGGVALLQQVFSSESPIVIVVSTLFTAALFAPLRERIQRAIDRRFYRRKYNAEKTLAAFGTKVRGEAELQGLCESLLSAADETMQPANVSLWLKVDQEKPDRH
jgi:hypothetical protein